MASEQQHNHRSRLWLFSLARAIWPDARLDAEESANTLFRFFRSKHVLDLKRIVLLTVTLLIIYLVSLAHAGTFRGNGEETIKVVFPALGATGVVIAWAYRSAAARLGVVDLFACEISTLCRVGTIMDIGNQYVKDYANPPIPSKRETGGPEVNQADSFVSKEDYFPILETNARDLQLLEALVVGHITEFYTYMKATRDLLRKLANIEIPSIGTQDDPWRQNLINVVYMLFLGYESGRKAVEDLIEFQPTRAEKRIVILLTELKCYSFLLEQYKSGDLHYDRLSLRADKYRQIVPQLCNLVRSSFERNAEEWDEAYATVSELEKRYEETLDAIARLKRPV
jgi:hypothetical protein